MERLAILYHPSSEAIALSAESWRLALQAARFAGWDPAGTLPPPLSFSDTAPTEWSGDYESPVGQEIASVDAARLGDALALVHSQSGELSCFPDFNTIAAFCQGGGFILCSGPHSSLDLIALAGHLSEPARMIEKTTPIPK